MAERNPRHTPATVDRTISREESPHPKRVLDDSLERENPDSDYVVVFSVPWIVRRASTGQDAINIAVSEVGKRLSSVGYQTQNIDISVQRIRCNECRTDTSALLLVSGTALVGLVLEVDIKAQNPDMAEKTARREIGPHLHNTPLASVEVTSTE